VSTHGGFGEEGISFDAMRQVRLYSQISATVQAFYVPPNEIFSRALTSGNAAGGSPQREWKRKAEK
jgi:hypothetical protein